MNKITNYWELTNTEVLTIFTQRAKQLFAYLESEFSLRIFKEEVSNNNVEIGYKNPDVAVILSFNTLDDMILITIRRVFDGNPARYTDDDNTILLEHLVQFINPSANIDRLQPQRWDFEQPLTLSAELLKKHGSEILSGKEWISERQALEKINRK